MNLGIPFINDKNFQISEATPVDDQTAYEPDIALDNNGALWVAWSSRSRSGDIICARRLLTDESSPKIEVSSSAGVEFQPCIIALNDRTQRIIWSANRNNRWQLLLREFIDSKPGQERVLAENSEGIFHPRMHLTQDGNCYLVFEQVIGSLPRLFLMTEKDGNMAWTSPIWVRFRD